jgi:AcrR family transcriptional regulator
VAENGHRSSLVAGSILEHATVLFDEKGYGETRLQDIADAMGVSRPTIYYYYKSKEEILIALLWDMVNADQVIEPATDTSLDPLERLRQVVLRIGYQVMDSPGRVRIINRNFPQLPERVQQEYMAERRRVRQALRSTLEGAVVVGAVRPVDPDLTTSMILGAMTGVPDWYHPENAASETATVEAMVELLLHGLAVTASERHDGTPEGVLKHMQQDMRHLERLLVAPKPSARRARKSS